MKINTVNSLLALKESLLVASRDSQKNGQELNVLLTKLSDLTEHGGRVATEQAILESLKFTRMRDRHSNIVEAHSKTFD